MNAKGFAVGNSWVATRQPDPAGGTISTIAGRSSSPLRPHERGGDVDVCVGRSPPRGRFRPRDLRTPGTALGSHHRPPSRPSDAERGARPAATLPGPVSRLQVEDVRGELVQRVSARRGPAHHELHGPGHRRQYDVHLHDPLTRVVKAEAVAQCRWGGCRVAAPPCPFASAAKAPRGERRARAQDRRGVSARVMRRVPERVLSLDGARCV